MFKRHSHNMKRLALLLFPFLLCNSSVGQLILPIEAPQDDLTVLGSSGYITNHHELQPLFDDYSDLLQIRFLPLKMNDMAAIFGPKLEEKPDDRVRPLFSPTVTAESGVAMPNSKRHVDYHSIGNIGYLEVHYQSDGESFATAVLYLRADDQFVPLRAAEDLARRETWEKARFDNLKQWLEDHMPKVIDLGAVEVSFSHPTRVDLGGGMTCELTTLDQHAPTAPFWISIHYAKVPVDPNEQARQYVNLSRSNGAVGITIDGKRYRLKPVLPTDRPIQ